MPKHKENSKYNSAPDRDYYGTDGRTFGESDLPHVEEPLPDVKESGPKKVAGRKVE